MGITVVTSNLVKHAVLMNKTWHSVGSLASATISLDRLTQCFSTFVMLWLFNTVSYVAGNPHPKIISLLPQKCNFVTVMSHMYVFYMSDIWYATCGGHDPKLEIYCNVGEKKEHIISRSGDSFKMSYKLECIFENSLWVFDSDLYQG